MHEILANMDIGDIAAITRKFLDTNYGWIENMKGKKQVEFLRCLGVLVSKIVGGKPLKKIKASTIGFPLKP